MVTTITNIVDGDTFDVSPGWSWQNQTGSRIRPTGYDAPELNKLAGIFAKTEVGKMLAGQQVELRVAYKVDRGRLVCDVYFRGVELASYFKKWA